MMVFIIFFVAIGEPVSFLKLKKTAPNAPRPRARASWKRASFTGAAKVASLSVRYFARTENSTDCRKELKSLVLPPELAAHLLTRYFPSSEWTMSAVSDAFFASIAAAFPKAGLDIRLLCKPAWIADESPTSATISVRSITMQGASALTTA